MEPKEEDRCSIKHPSSGYSSDCSWCQRVREEIHGKPKAITVQDWRERLRLEFKNAETKTIPASEEEVFDWLESFIEKVRTNALEEQKEKIMEKINSAGGIGGLNHLIEIIESTY